jgi:hypothetical protein
MTKKDLSSNLLKEEFGGDVEASAETPDVLLVELALAAQNL